MRVFSNGQFDVEGHVYVLEVISTGNKRIGRFLPRQEIGSSIPKDQIVLEYSSRGPYSHDSREDNKFFTLKLYANGKVIKKFDDLSIEKSGDNKNYKKAIKFMIERAMNISKVN
jgi:hypothetical protein